MISRAAPDPRPRPPRALKVLAIDPGRDKNGVAVVAAPCIVLVRRIFRGADLQGALLPLIAQHGISQIVLGDSTTSRKMHDQLVRWLPQIRVALVDETASTLEARSLYWEHHARRGWRRVLPISLLEPPKPIDDFAAVVLAARYFAALAQGEG